jgi:hypothetical protein
MAHSTKKGHGNAWLRKKTDEQFKKVETTDGTEYTLHLPNFNQSVAYNKSLKKYKDVFDQIKTNVKEGDAILGNGLPDLDHIAWAELLSSTLKELNKPWKVKEKIWIYNKLYERDPEHIAMYVAITPNIAQNTDKSSAKKVSAATEAAAASSTTTNDDAGYIIHQDDIEYGPMIDPISRTFLGLVYFKTKNGLTYYYHTKEDAHNNKYFKVEEEDKEINTEDEAEAEDEYETEAQAEGDIYDYNNGVPPYPGARWDDEFRNWVSDPFDMDEEDEEDEEAEADEAVEDRDTALARMVEEDAAIAAEEARIADEHARTADKHASIAKEHARNAEKARIEVEKDREEKKRNLKLRTAVKRRAHHEKLAGAEESASVAKQARIEEPARIAEEARIAEADRIAEMARIAADPRLVEPSKDLPPGWKAYISRTHNLVYYYKPPPPGEIGEGTRVWEKPKAGGKRTKKRLRRKSTSKQMKKKRTTTRRKMTTTRRK